MPIPKIPDQPCPNIAPSPRYGSPMDWWYGAQKAFVARGIMNRRDLLPAIAGIAIKIIGRTLYNYACGLWTGDFHRGLLWTTEVGSDRLEGDAVPTWSWALLSLPQSHLSFFVFFFG